MSTHVHDLINYLMQLGDNYLTGYVYMKNMHRFILIDQIVTNPSKLKNIK